MDARTNATHTAVQNGGYDVARVRADFPILSREVYGKPLVYLDNAASAQKPRAVLDRMRDAYEQEYANVHRGLHLLATAATERDEGARETVRSFHGHPRTSPSPRWQENAGRGGRRVTRV